MPYIIAFSTFVTVTLMCYGLLHRTVGGGTMDVRLGGLRYSRPNREAIPDPDAAFSQRVLRPIFLGLSKRAQGILPSTMSERLEKAMIQGGMKMKPGQLLLICAFTAGVLPSLATLYVAGMHQPLKIVAGTFVFMTILGIYGPRVMVMGRVKRRQKAIWRSLPDAFDLITASVEAGLGIDAAFTRVIEKVHGPFAEELTRTMREIQMGRSRKDSFLDMADRTGVDELRQLINAVIQAEAMGISIGGVIRVQTGVIRTKRRQKAEEQAFKAPIKMVFPLVFFIFPAIMIVIGGPAIIQMKNNI